MPSCHGICILHSDVRRGPGGLGPPIFDRSVNPIPTGEGRLSPPNTTGTPNVFHLPASLHLKVSKGQIKKCFCLKTPYLRSRYDVCKVCHNKGEMFTMCPITLLKLNACKLSRYRTIFLKRSPQCLVFESILKGQESEM